MIELTQFGWNNFFENQLEKLSKENYSVGRVARENKNNYILYTSFGDLCAEVSGKFSFDANCREDFPAVGDWVLIRPLLDEKKAIIEHILKRKNKFSRNAAGSKLDQQLIASNIDVVFIMSSLNQDINLRRIERYLTLTLENSLKPVIILSKADVCSDIEGKIYDVKEISFDTNIHVISAIENTGIEEIQNYFIDNQTVALIGSSGVGKSTLINRLTEKTIMDVSDISLYKDKGRHTTSHRELVVLPNGGLIMDTPGMRELQLWEGNYGVSETFQDIEKYLGHCKFSDCQHETEPGCAIKKAIDDGEFDERRFKSYLKLQREVRHFENRSNQKAKLTEKKKWKKNTSQAKRNNKYRF